jgi:hypothetical protein
MIRLPNHIEEHEKMRAALASLRQTARPVEPGPLLRGEEHHEEPLRWRPRKDEGASHWWAAVGLACLLGSALVTMGLIVGVAVHLLDVEEQVYLAQVVGGGLVLIVGGAVVAEALYQMERKR